jgi:hypothetical protein
MRLPSATLRILTVITSGVVAAACGNDAVSSSPDAARDASSTGADIAAPVDVSPAPDLGVLPETARCGEHVALLRARAWPGGGIQVTAALSATGSTPATTTTTPRLRTASGAVIPAAVAHTPAIRGVTAVVIAGPIDSHAIAAFLEALPNDRVAMWLADDAGMRLLGELTSDHAHLVARARNALAAASFTGAFDAAAMAAAATRIASVGGSDAEVDRSLVVLGVDAPSLAPVAATGARDAVRLFAAKTDNAESVGRTIAARRHGLHRVGACLPAGDAAVALLWNGAECALPNVAGDAHLADVACSAEAAANDAWPWGQDVEFVFTSDEAAIWEERRATKNRDDFALAVRIDQGLPLRATAKLRGQTSMDCERKSYNVEFVDGAAHRLMPGSVLDRFHLIAMCRDVAYHNQLFADRLGQQLGFFPLQFRVVRLVANGVEQGAYMLLEKSDDALVQDMVEPWGVLRRRFDPEDEPPDVDWTRSSVDDATALTWWDALNDDARDGALDGLAERLEQHMDLDGYLRWMAFNTWMGNGDYVDEAIFHGGVEAGGPWLRVLGWDPDDLFSACHHGGRFALDDPHDLVYCAEAHLDHALLRSPEIYARYVDILASLLDTVGPEMVQAAMDATHKALFDIVKDDAVAKAMVELVALRPEAATAGGFEAVVREYTTATLAKVETSRATLRERIAAWREQNR